MKNAITSVKAVSEKIFELTPVDVPFINEAFLLTQFNKSTLVSPIAVLAMMLRENNVKLLLSYFVSPDVEQTVLANLDLALNTYIEDTSIEPEACREFWNELYKSGKYSDAAYQSTAMLDFAHNFKRNLENGSKFGAALVFESALGTEVETFLDDIMEGLINIKYREFVNRIREAEEKMFNGNALLLSKETYYKVLTIIHFIGTDQEILHKIDFEGLDVEEYTNRFMTTALQENKFRLKFLNGKEVVVTPEDVEEYLNAFSGSTTGIKILLGDMEGLYSAISNSINEYRERDAGTNICLLVDRFVESRFMFWKLPVREDRYGYVPSASELLYLLLSHGHGYEDAIELLTKFNFSIPSAMNRELCEEIVKLSKEPASKKGNVEATIDEIVASRESDKAEEAETSSPKETEEVSKGKRNRRQYYNNSYSTVDKTMEASSNTNESELFKFGDWSPSHDGALEYYMMDGFKWDKYTNAVDVALHRKLKRSIMFIGDSGTGKTAFLKHLAAKYNLSYDFETNTLKRDTMKPFNLVVLDLEGVVNVAIQKGSVESHITNLVNRIIEARNKGVDSVIVVDNYHGTITTGPYGVDGGGFLAKECLNNNIPIIAATTYEGYRESLANDPIYRRAFDTVDFDEPDKDATLKILSNVANRLNSKLEISESFLADTYMVASKFIRRKANPDKAIDLLDKAVAMAELQFNCRAECQAVEAGKEKEVIDSKVLWVIAENDFKVPAMQINKNRMEAVKSLESSLKSKVFGQDEAIMQFLKRWKIYQAGMGGKDKPIGSFLFIGPTGVGKTELSKRIAEFTGRELIRFDMSEYSDSFTVSKLIGSPNGYVGYNEGGLLVQRVLKNPNCVLLLDEIEKAHPDVYNLLLQAMDNAEITGNKGEKVDFRNAIIIMTSNCGARLAQETKAIGFGAKPDKAKTYDMELRRVFAPEFLGRINSIVTFQSLTDDICENICESQMKDLESQLKEQYNSLDSIVATDELKSYLINKLDVKNTGARGITNAIDTHIKEELCEFLLLNYEELAESSHRWSIKLSLSNDDKCVCDMYKVN